MSNEKVRQSTRRTDVLSEEELQGLNGVVKTQNTSYTIVNGICTDVQSSNENLPGARQLSLKIKGLRIARIGKDGEGADTVRTQLDVGCRLLFFVNPANTHPEAEKIVTTPILTIENLPESDEERLTEDTADDLAEVLTS